MRQWDDRHFWIHEIEKTSYGNYKERNMRTYDSEVKYK